MSINFLLLLFNYFARSNSILSLSSPLCDYHLSATERKVKYDLSIATKYEVGGDRYEVECKVCGNAIDITEKQEQHVVKCEGCGEATVSCSWLEEFTI